MSTSLDIMTETNFEKFLEQYDNIIYIMDPMRLLEKSSQYYTNFSGKTYRLYDIVLEGE